ncbi:hypothetical protein B0O80DRAFT_504161 [Mortierella sp. GBAus27b]|nr:hypothetical protein BGX31_001086 [Mortierella sp. GBA43]KAI8345624.1 hypothetical protein B0O80DRAFT_504161 [Mortierella sp. GBAus27b]
MNKNLDDLQPQPDLNIKFSGKKYTFCTFQDPNYKGCRAQCPECSAVIDRGKARRHLESCLNGETGDDDDAEGEPPEVGSSKKRGHGIDDLTVWKRLCGEVPSKMLESTMEAMQANAFMVDGHGMILPKTTASFLSKILKPGFKLAPIEVRSRPDRILTPEELQKDFDEMSPSHLAAVNSGGIVGLERIVGAILCTGKHQFKVTCAEVYNRDVLQDPHAESQFVAVSSVPSDGPSTQYKGDVKIIKMPGEFNTLKLEIGVRSHNYLITSGFRDNVVHVGPAHCGEFPVNQETKIYFRKERQEPTFLDGDILGLAQVRSNFGHYNTYKTRRAALRGYGSVAVMPVTVFTLSQFGVKYSRVFRELAVRAMAEEQEKIILHLKDVEVPPMKDSSQAANMTRDLLSLFEEDTELDVTTNSPAEKVLSQLAGRLSSDISKKNTRIASNILNLD